MRTASSVATRNRFLPDLALPTALDSSVNPGLAFCLSGSTAASGCTLVRSGGSGVATAFFAGVAALINQKERSPRQSAPSLYATSRINGVFNDVAQGTAQLPCVPGSSGCNASGLIGYAAGSGYDLATGLGVPDVQKLVTELAKPQVTGATPTITLSISPAQANNTYNPSALVTFTAKVVDPTDAGIPTGTANLYNSTNYDVLTADFPLTSSGSATSGSSATIGPMELSNLYNYSGPGAYHSRRPLQRRLHLPRRGFRLSFDRHYGAEPDRPHGDAFNEFTGAGLKHHSDCHRRRRCQRSTGGQRSTFRRRHSLRQWHGTQSRGALHHGRRHKCGLYTHCLRDHEFDCCQLSGRQQL